jgi:microcystin-dependent protein
MKKLDAEPRLQGASASVIEWARKVVQAVNALSNAFTGDALKIANGGTGATTAAGARDALGAQLEPGIVGFTAAAVPPPGWLKRNGAAVSRTTYAALFAAIGTTYGAGDGSTTFNLPEARGEFDRGWDDGRGIDPARVRGSSQGDALQGHNHQIQSAIGTALGASYNAVIVGTYLATENMSSRGTFATVIEGNGVNGSPRVANETRARNVAYLAIIKY